MTAPPGFEPGTCALTVRYSTAELWSNKNLLVNNNTVAAHCQPFH